MNFSTKIKNARFSRKGSLKSRQRVLSEYRLLCKLRRSRATSALFAAKSNGTNESPLGSDSNLSRNKKTDTPKSIRFSVGAGDGNRTHVVSLEG